MTDNVRAAVQGALVGWTLGSQTRGRRELKYLSFYDPIPPRMSASEAIESWLVWSQHVRSVGVPHSLARSLLAHWNYPSDESAFGLGHVALGLTSPVSGSFANPLSRGSNAIGRSVYWGLVFHGKPDEAAEHAYYDASIDHAGEGVWVPVALARAMALLSPGKTVTDLVRDIGNGLPKSSDVLRAMGPILKSVGKPDGVREVHEQLPALLGIADPQDAALTASWIMLGLLHGGLDFERCVLVTAGCGGASGHSTLACGAICAHVSGSVPLAWTKPLGELMVYGHGLRGIDGPKSIDSLVSLVAKDAEQFSTPPLALPTAEGEAPASVTQAISPQSDFVKSLLEREPVESFVDVGTVRVSAQYIDSPVATAGAATKFALRFENTGESAITITPSVEGPRGFELAHKIGEFVLNPGGASTFAVVYKAPTSMRQREVIKVTLPDGEAEFPVFAPQLWYVVGPMTNQEGTGFDKEYPCEKNVRLGQVFNGRSNLPVEWTALLVTSPHVDVEKIFGAGPGTLYLYANVRMSKAGRYRIVVASGVGAIVWIDDKKAYWYHDTHNPVPRAVDPYTGSFYTDGEVRVMIKTFRNLSPVPPLTIYFLAEDGSLAVPAGFDPIA